MKEQEYQQGVGDPFDSPVAGQSLTDTPGNYPWEHPPQFFYLVLLFGLLCTKNHLQNN